jgi:hypothetical protein
MVLTPYINLKEKILMAEEKVGLQSMFGKPDRKGNKEDGQVQSEYPAHMMNAQIDTLDNAIMELGSDLKGGRIPGGDIYEAKEELNLLQQKFDDIVVSKPNYSPSEENFLQGELALLNQRVGDTLYSRYDQQKGKGSIARPQQEADLNDKPCIKIHPEIAKICNITNVVNGKVSRNLADKARKILCAYFGREDGSRERIRAENNASRQRPMVGYTNEAFARRHRQIFGDKKAMDPNNMLEENPIDPEIESPEILQDRIDKLRAKISHLETMPDPAFVNTIEVEKPKKQERVTKIDKSFVCEEPDCGFVGKLSQKGAHVLKHRKETAKAKEMELAEQED